ncbi:MAG TPA: cephalosporin hydroxylase family protein [Candidatus Eremiobacteraceae bacterium]|nr:cephalosporin hydroxylase family protein [Candidatus Eremiobacteraceae bacterium]
MSDNRASDPALLAAMRADRDLARLSAAFMEKTIEHRYSYNFTWLGIPIIQYPQDVVALQEIIWEYKPELIIETGVAHGGSTVFFASMLEMIGTGGVLGIDVDIRAHNRMVIQAHPLARRIELLDGSSTDPAVVAVARERAAGKRVVVVLDSNHTADHVAGELEAYSPLVKSGGYLVVFDTIIETLPGTFPDRPWSHGNNPMTAVHSFLRHDDRFEIAEDILATLLVTAAPDGYLRCVKD